MNEVPLYTEWRLVKRGGVDDALEAGSYLRLIDFLYHSTLGLRVIKKKKKMTRWALKAHGNRCDDIFFFFFITLKPRVE